MDGQGVGLDGTIREVGIAPKPLQQPIPVYSGSTHRMRTVLYWAAKGGKPLVLSDNYAFCEMLGIRYRDTAEEHGRPIPAGEEEAWAKALLWFWEAWSIPYGQSHRTLLIGDPDPVSRQIEEACQHLKFNEACCLFGQGVFEHDKCMKTLELMAEKVMPHFKN